MKSKKVIATILTLSLLIPASGCNKKEDIIAKVTEYADAVISGETDDPDERSMVDAMIGEMGFTAP